MQIKRFLGNIARTYLAIGSLSMAAVAGADEMYQPMVYQEPYAHDGFSPMGNEGSPVMNDGYSPMMNDGGFSPVNSGGACCCNQAPACGWGYNPPGYLNCGGNSCCGNGFWDTLRFRVDFLWWRAQEDGLSLGAEQTTNTFDTECTHEFEGTSRCKKPDFKFDAGFRIGFASICNNCWDIGLNWTHFHTRAHARGFNNLTNEDNLVVFENFWEGVENQFPDAAHSRWVLDMDLLDLEIGHKYYVDHCFILRPYAGLRGARLDQKFRVFSFANRVTGVDGVPPQRFESHVHARNDFRGFGPRVGLDLEFKFACGVSIFGQAAGSLVFGRFEHNSNERFDDFNTTPCTNILLHFKSNSQRVSRAITDLAIGLKWDHCFEWCCRCHPVSVAFTWEHHGFFRFNNFQFRTASFDEDSTHFEQTGNCGEKFGDLFTHGLTVSAEIGF